MVDEMLVVKEVPSGYKLVRDYKILPISVDEKVVVLNERKQKFIDEAIPEPSDEELLEFAKNTHPYYENEYQISLIDDELKELR